MPLAALRLEYTFDEYVRFERDALHKHEYVEGAILAMAGGMLDLSINVDEVYFDPLKAG